MTDEIKIRGGLLKLPKDSRDFSLTNVFGAITELPEGDFEVSQPIAIKDQGTSDMCAAYACCAVSEDQEGVLLSPEYLFMKAKEKKKDWMSWGMDLRTICKVATEGSLAQNNSPYSYPEKTRNFIANWDNWINKGDLDKLAKNHAKKSYFKVDGSKSVFDSFRGALWANRDDHRSILTGVMWRSGWNRIKDEIIPKEKSREMFGHAIKIYGQKRINGELHLVAQLSNGKDIGVNGLLYFSREVIDRDFKFGAFMLKDMDRYEAEMISWTLRRRFLHFIKRFVKKINNIKS